MTTTPARSSGLRDRLLEDAAALPLGNQAALFRVADLCRDRDASARDVATEAQRDEGFTALLLRMANSAYSASAMRIGDLSTAIGRLGFNVVGGLAVASPGLRLLAGPNDGLAPKRKELHRHAVRTGIAARMLARDGDDEHALSAGLVHNIGMNVLALYAPPEFREVVEIADSGRQLREVEVDLLGFTHAELGAQLAENWKFPPTLVSAIADHDAPEPTGIAALIQVADLLVRESGIGIEAPAEISETALQAYGVDVEAARATLGPLFAAQERVEARMADEAQDEPEPSNPQHAFAQALDSLA